MNRIDRFGLRGGWRSLLRSRAVGRCQQRCRCAVEDLIARECRVGAEVIPVSGVDDVFILQPRIGPLDACDDIAADRLPNRALHGNVGGRVQHHGVRTRLLRPCRQPIEVAPGQRTPRDEPPLWSSGRRSPWHWPARMPARSPPFLRTSGRANRCWPCPDRTRRGSPRRLLRREIELELPRRIVGARVALEEYGADVFGSVLSGLDGSPLNTRTSLCLTSTPA